jgi:hypothetical protein
MEERLLYLLESVLGKSKKTSGDNYAFWSPFANHHKPKLEINIKMNTTGENPWHCWISDERGKTIRSLFRKLKVSSDVWDEHNSIFSRKYRYADVVESKQDSNQVLRLPDEYIPLWNKSNSIIRKHALSYLERRGVTAAEILKYQIGYCETGAYKNKLIVPSYNDYGMLNYFVGRSFYDSEPKHKNPQVSKDVVGFDMLINWDLPIVICEGVYDAIAIRMNAIPLFGKSPQSQLQKKIVEKGVSKIYIALDSDAFQNALRFAENLMNMGIDVYLVEMGESDPSELGFDRIHKKIENAEQLSLRRLMEYKLMGI